MTTEELKTRILEECEKRLNANPSAEELSMLAKTYSELTQRDWVESIYKSVNPMWDSCAGAPIPKIQNEQEN